MIAPSPLQTMIAFLLSQYDRPNNRLPHPSQTRSPNPILKPDRPSPSQNAIALSLPKSDRTF